MNKKQLALRVGTALIGFAYLGVGLYLRGWFMRANLVFVMMMAIMELNSALKAEMKPPPPLPQLLFAAFSVPAIYFYREAGLLALMTLTMMMMFCQMLIKRDADGHDVFACALGAVYPALPISLILLQVEFVSEAYVVNALTLTFMVAFCCDSLAFIGGNLFGRHKLLPLISPKKTWEGAAFGLLGGIIVALLIGAVATEYHYGIPFIHYPIIGALGAAASQIGDLTSSAIKRVVGIKDFGDFFPGHGGMLDRFDGVFFCGMLVYCYFLVFII